MPDFRKEYNGLMGKKLNFVTITLDYITTMTGGFVRILSDKKRRRRLTINKCFRMIYFHFFIYYFHFRFKNIKNNFNTIKNNKGIQSLRNEKQKIPYKIFQTFKTRHVPEMVFRATQEWIRLNPEYDYIFFDDQEILDYIEKEKFENFNFTKKDFMKTFQKIKPGAGKADLFRLLIIYNEGGCYFDIDNICINPLKTFIHEDDEVVKSLAVFSDFYPIEQWGFMYTKNHPFMKNALELAIKNINSIDEKNTIDNKKPSLMELTGPICLYNAIKATLNIEKYEFKIGLNNINNYKITVLDHCFNFNVSSKYLNYLEDLKKLKVSSWGDIDSV